MNKSVEALLESFERLPEEAKREAALEIIRRAAHLSLPPLEDATLVEAAEKIIVPGDSNSAKHRIISRDADSAVPDKIGEKTTLIEDALC